MSREGEERRKVDTEREGHRGINVVDLIIGLALIPIVPICFWVFAGMVWGKPDPPRDKPVIDPPPDEEEVDLRWKEIEALYQNAQGLRQQAETVEDLNLKEYFRRWRDQCFGGVKGKLTDLKTFIDDYAEKHPEIKTTFGVRQEQITALRRQVAADLAKAKEFDATKDAGK